MKLRKMKHDILCLIFTIMVSSPLWAGSGDFALSEESWALLAGQVCDDKSNDRVGLQENSRIGVQVVILKADDLVFKDSVNVFPQRWETYLDYIIKQDIPSSVGVILSSLDKGNQQYANKVRNLQIKHGIELWNHGYTHDMSSKNEKGEKTYEFWKTPETFQVGQFLKSQKVAKEKLGITIRTFGSPGNGRDSSTTRAISKIPELKVWLYGDPASDKFVLKRVAKCDLEFPVHNPDFAHFEANYDASEPYLLLQYHPMSWDERRFDEFKKIINFLLAKGVRFMTPYAYYQEVSGDKGDSVNR
jgi:peptidoglycan/xylan/chitin deacetylase (PgdA/CDA1 family)